MMKKVLIFSDTWDSFLLSVHSTFQSLGVKTVIITSLEEFNFTFYSGEQSKFEIAVSQEALDIASVCAIWFYGLPHYIGEVHTEDIEFVHNEIISMFVTLFERLPLPCINPICKIQKRYLLEDSSIMMNHLSQNGIPIVFQHTPDFSDRDKKNIVAFQSGPQTLWFVATDTGLNRQLAKEDIPKELYTLHEKLISLGLPSWAWFARYEVCQEQYRIHSLIQEVNDILCGKFRHSIISSIVQSVIATNE